MSSNFDQKNIVKLQSKEHLPNFNPKKHLQTLIKKHLQISIKRHLQTSIKKTSSNFNQKNIFKLQSKEHLPNSNPKKIFSTGKFPQISLTLRFQTVSPTWRNSAGAVSNRMVF